MKFLLLFTFVLAPLFANEQFSMGKEIYEDTCISCHGEDGNADVNVKFVVKPRSLKSSILTEEQSYKIIKDGAHYWGANADIMPAFDSVYDEDQLHAVAYYIKKEFNPAIKEKITKLYAQSDAIPKEKITKMMKRGKKIYKRNCSWCHGTDAKGDGDATRNPEKSIYPYDLSKTLLTDEQMFLYAKFGGKFWGTDKDDMPSWKRKYNDFTLKSVVFYIEETFRKGEK
jgi:mono/diheme cytochrome c family protein